MDNLRGLLNKGEQINIKYIVPEICDVNNGVDERIYESILRFFRVMKEWGITGSKG